MTHNIQYWKYTSNDFLNEFLNYSNIIENYLVRQYFNKRNSSITDSEIPTLSDIELIKFSKEHYEYGTFYPQSFRTSFFTQIFSIFEYELKEICQIYHKENKTVFSIEDLKGNSEIEKAKLFLKKTCEIDFMTLEPEWSYLNTIRKIRNIFIHHKGEIRKTHNDWNIIREFIDHNKNGIGFGNSAEYLDKEKFIELYDNNSIFNIEISNSIVNEKLIISIKTFLKNLALQLDAKEKV